VTYRKYIKFIISEYLVVLPLVLFCGLYIWFNLFFAFITDKHILHTDDEHPSVQHYLIEKYEILKKGKQDRIKEKSASIWKNSSKNNLQKPHSADSLPNK
jgi:hypothetical protein